jgi:hypothetical protein
MTGDIARHLKGSAQDFFYLARRSAAPLRSTFTFEPLSDPNLRLVARGRRTIAHIEVTALRFALDQFHASYARGSRDSKIPGGESALDDEPLQFDFVLSSGHATRGSRPGLTLLGTPFIPQKLDYGTLVLPTKGVPELLEGKLASDGFEGSSLAQFPLLISEGRPTSAARQIGETRSRAALCLVGGFGLWVSAKSDSAVVLMQSLLDEGCSSAILLDRGSHEEATLVLREPKGSSVSLPREGSYLVFRREAGQGRAFYVRKENGNSAPP